ncbi:AAA family ATPase [Nostoc sp. KVJ3]|uniref:AAA family ATPase n=1 Tax=Nostoc sp. KVJ3 TaxID=457945 RepID=UPI002237C603|nr:AAA family ATPase [Nostoc sp. KVJ3]MCW5313410.1 AAA family ATPase [Nostoc sp. KVJ3]
MVNPLVSIPGYRISEELYNGSRTLVYRGYRDNDSLPVVIKLLKNPYPGLGELVQFRNQYTIAKNLNSPLIIATYSLEPYQNGYALVMEDFGGISLKDYFTRVETLHTTSLEEFLEIAIALCNALDILYRERIIHKDIKPSNILINPETKEVKLIDFSIASLLPRETQSILSPNILEGTIAYISPEQTGRMNRGIDYRTDFYSLGVTFYELLTGVLPFLSNDAMELVHYHIAKSAPLVHAINPKVPSILSEIVSKLMAKNAEDRYQSALGLKFDLENCLHQLQVSGTINDFEIARRDVCDRFIIPDKLYGRETEVSTLLQAFERVSLGATEMMLVAGFSGIGKTAVVNEVHKPIVRQRGYFIKGKYDQFNRNIPFSAFVQAFRDLMEQLLTLSDPEIKKWKSKILSAVGENGQIIIEVIPELEIIIGQQSPVPELSGSAAQNRFNSLFQKFTQVFTSAEHPLVMFLDDLQWADSASLKLMQLLMTDTSHLFLIGAYRDNEVNSGHPFILTLGEIAKTQATINTITLAPLSQTKVNQLVADTLKCPEDLAWSLSQLIYQKTQGNPFFATQFLKALYEDKLIQFTPPTPPLVRGGWQYNIAQVNQQAVTDDIVVFMAKQLQRLPSSSQKVLQLAACIGNQFDLATLAIISEQSEIDTSADLWKALQSGLVLPISDTYKFYQQESFVNSQDEQKQMLSDNEQITVSYKFLHDRVQQAAYSLIPDEQKTVTHLKIGQLLLQNLSQIELDEKLFDIAMHLNLGQEFITQVSEREVLAQLNFKAGVKARNSTAYAAARVYLQTGIKLLQTNCWQNQYELTLNLYATAAEVASLNGDFDGMEQLATIILQKAQTILDKVKIYEIKIAAQTAQSQTLEAIAIARDVLGQLGVEFPTEVDEAKIDKALQAVASQLQGRQIAELLDLPVMSDRTAQAAMQLLGTLFAPVLLGIPGLMPFLSATMVNLSLQFGNAPASTVGYVIHGMVLCTFLGEVENGYNFGKLALSLLERFNTPELKSVTLHLFGAYIQHQQEPLRATRLTLKDGYTAGMDTGDFIYGGYNLSCDSHASFFAGVELDTCEPERAAYSVTLAQMKQFSALVYFGITWQTVKNLRETVSQPDCLIGESYDETVMIPKHHQDHELTAIATAYIYKLLLAYTYGNYQVALNYIGQANPYLMSTSGLIYFPIFHFYAALTHLALFPTQSEPEQAEILTQVETHQTTLHQWAKNAPMNHLHKWYLVEAERYRVLGDKIAAIECYDQAITLANKHQFINEEALANELAAKFYLGWGKHRIAGEYITNAYYSYARWGAKAKVADLERRYPQLLAPILQQTRSPFSTNETVFALESVTSTSSPSTSSSVSIALDLAAILKASQTISCEIEFEKLLSSLLSILIENAGAEKCVLMLMESDNLLIQALAGLNLENNGNTKVDFSSMLLNPQPVKDSIDVPVGLINNVKRSLKPAVIIDASVHPQLINDPYIQQKQPKSILCSPILHQGKLLGVLYLENNLATGAFTSDRIELLNLLCAQAAISLENARLYRNSQNYAQQLEQSLAKLQDSEIRFQNLANNIPGMVYQFRLAADGSTSTPYVSSGCLDLYGLTPESVMTGMYSLYSMHHPEDDAAIAEAIAYSAQNLTPFEQEWRIILPSGTVKWVQSAARATRQADGATLWDGFVIDISDRKQVEASLAKEREFLNAIIHNITDGIVVCDASGKLTLFNNATCEFHGLPIKSLPPEQWAEHFNLYQSDGKTPLSTTEIPLFRAFQGEIVENAEMVIVPKYGSTRILLASGQAIVDSSGNKLGAVVVMRDISSHKKAGLALQQKSLDLEQALKGLQQAQLQMVQSEKMSALGNLVAGVAHEMNNPLGFIAASLKQAKPSIADIVEHLKLYQVSQPNPTDEIIEHAIEIDLDYTLEDLPKMIDSMTMACDRLKNISTSLRTFSRADRDYKVPFNIHQGIDSTILILKHRLKANELRPAIEVVTNYDDLPQLECFPGQLNQVFMNILANAIDALDESNSGRSLIEIQANPNRITIKTSKENNLIKIAIADNGKGMSESVKQKIFDHLFTTKSVGKGTGLGLAIARQIVEETHGGKLSCHSVISEGTEFLIEIPV